MKLTRFPRVRITHGPTPLEFLPRLTEALGGPNLYIKRDDCTGLATGGNKTRKLEFLMADAMSQKADIGPMTNCWRFSRDCSLAPYVP